MQKTKFDKALLWRGILLLLAIGLYFGIPKNSSGDIIGKEDVWFPFTLLSIQGRVILTNFRMWVIPYFILFSSILICLELIRNYLKIPKNKVAKGMVLAVFIICMGLLLYFTIGSILKLGPLAPMPFNIWVLIFGKGSYFLTIWWTVSAVLL